MSVFQQAFSFTLHNEGGYSNHPDDRGGKTHYGITESTARRHGIQNVELLTLSDAMDIYFKEYWPVAEPIARFAPRIAIKVFDTGVVCGPRMAVKFLQRAITDLGIHVDDDGIWGLQTLGALKRCLNEKSEDLILQYFISELTGYFTQLAHGHPSQKVFLKGWLNRARRLPPALPPEPDPDE